MVIMRYSGQEAFGASAMWPVEDLNYTRRAHFSRVRVRRGAIKIKTHTLLKADDVPRFSRSEDVRHRLCKWEDQKRDPSAAEEAAGKIKIASSGAEASMIRLELCRS